MNAITLQVKSVQKTYGEEPLEIDFVTEGKLYHKQGTDYIVYEETELSGLAGHRTTLKIQSDRVVMHRYGPTPSDMYFQVGLRETADYQTPYGDLQLEYLTHHLTCDMAEHAGTITIEYALSIKGLREATHSLAIQYRVNNNG